MSNGNGKKATLLKPTKELYQAEEEQELGIVGQKIEAARKQKSMSKKELQRQLEARGVEVAYLSVMRWEKNEAIPNAYQLLAICDALDIPDSYSYFMNGTAKLNEAGLQKVEEYRADLIASGKYAPTRIPGRNAVKYREMPVSTLAASAGTGEFLDDENIELIRFPESSIPAGADYALRVNGDSMEPMYMDHQLVWVQTCHALRPGEVGIFILDGEGYIKSYDEVEPEMDEVDDYTDSNGVVHNKPILISLNKKYAPKVVSRSSKFIICGRVLN